MTFAEKAEMLKPRLIHRTVRPSCTVKIIEDSTAFQALRAEKCEDVCFPIAMAAGESVTVDFGEHLVGYFNIKLGFDGKIPDSPVRFSYVFGELPCEVCYPTEAASGELKNWLQDDYRAYPFLPCDGRLERRYAFRYLKITRTDNSKDYSVNIEDMFCDAVSAVSSASVEPLNTDDGKLRLIDKISVNTLKECMQEVFEDGPKRDRRLWLGDLRLEALTDYLTFKNTDLIKRCLYLFAAYCGENGRVHPCLFENSPPVKPDYFLADYSMLFISCVYDYTVHTGDTSLAEELYDTAYAQFLCLYPMFDREHGMPSASHIDWCPDLDKSASFEGLFLYTLRQLLYLSELCNRPSDKITEAVVSLECHMRTLLDKESNLIVSGKSRQISQASQIWGVLSGAFSKSECRIILDNLSKRKLEYKIHSPYMYHYYVEALYSVGLDKEAEAVIKSYWGTMADYGVDTFFEVFDPENHSDAPYGDILTNSACHAWSCTPAYWLRKKLGFISK